MSLYARDEGHIPKLQRILLTLRYFTHTFDHYQDETIYTLYNPLSSSTDPYGSMQAYA